MTLRLVRAALPDAPLIQALQRIAFDRLLKVYEDFDTNPACESLDRIQAKLSRPFTYFYLIWQNDQIVGGIRVVDQHNGERKRISPLFVLPDFQDHGVAQAAIREAEARHGAEGWSLGTILQEPKNCHLYEKLGYRRTGASKVINDRMTLVFYEK